MNAIEGRARFWDGPAVAARVVELSTTGALVVVPWSRSFTEDDAMAAYSACPALELSGSLTVRCTVRWVSCGENGLQFGIGLQGVDAADAAELVELAASVSTASRPVPRPPALIAELLSRRAPRGTDGKAGASNPHPVASPTGESALIAAPSALTASVQAAVLMIDDR